MRIWGFMIAAYIAAALINVGVEGGSGFAQSTLASAIDSSTTTIPVASVSGFLAQDILYIDSEIVYYATVSTSTNSFVGVTRGYRDTRAAEHPAGRIVRSSDANALNALVGFNVSESVSVVGIIKVPFILGIAVLHAVPKLLTLDFAYMNSGAGLYVKYLFWLVAGAMLVWRLIELFIGTAGGLFRR